MLNDRDGLACGLLAKMRLDTIVDGEVNRPGGKVPEDGGAEAAVETSEAIVREDGLDGSYVNGRFAVQWRVE